MNNTAATCLTVAFALMLACEHANARFFKAMSAMQISQEITVQLMRGGNLVAIAKDAHDAGIKSEQVTAVLIRSGQDPRAVVTSLIKIDQPAAPSITAAALACRLGRTADIVAAALAASPQQRDLIVAKALTVPMINPNDVLGATAAGGETSVPPR